MPNPDTQLYKTIRESARLAHWQIDRANRNWLGALLVKNHEAIRIAREFERGNEACWSKNIDKAITRWIQTVQLSISTIEEVRKHLLGRLIFTCKHVWRLKEHLRLAQINYQKWKEADWLHRMEQTPPAFDNDYYLKQVAQEDLKQLTPYEHYKKNGWRLGLNPSPLFDVEWYLKQNLDVRMLEREPFGHYLKMGWMEGRDPHPLFKSTWYIKTNGLLLGKLMDPLTHYLTRGFLEGRTPNPTFDHDGWVKKFPEVSFDTLAPFTHYITSLGPEGVQRQISLAQATLRGFGDNHLQVLHLDNWSYLEWDNNKECMNQSPKVAVHIHVYYVCVFEEMLDYLVRIPFSFDLFVSTNSTAKAVQVENLVKNLAAVNTLKIMVTPNRGRDVAPMIAAFGRELLRYDVALHAHTKKSPDYPGGGEPWLRHNMECLCYSEDYVSNVWRTMRTLPKCGILFPSPWSGLKNAIKWGCNEHHARGLFHRLKISPYILLLSPLMFPVGNMFWFRPGALRPLLESNIDYKDFPEEPIPNDGTLAHAVERILLYVAQHEGYSSSAIEPSRHAAAI